MTGPDVWNIVRLVIGLYLIGLRDLRAQYQADTAYRSASLVVPVSCRH
jgi:hypothetical protein